MYDCVRVSALWTENGLTYQQHHKVGRDTSVARVDPEVKRSKVYQVPSACSVRRRQVGRTVLYSDTTASVLYSFFPRILFAVA